MSKFSSLLCGVSLLVGWCTTPKTQLTSHLTTAQIAIIFQSYSIKKHVSTRDKKNRKNIGVNEYWEPISDTIQIAIDWKIFYLEKNKK